jgi:hypothetical protein
MNTIEYYKIWNGKTKEYKHIKLSIIKDNTLNPLQHPCTACYLNTIVENCKGQNNCRSRNIHYELFNKDLT